MAAGAALRVGFVIADVFVAGHTGCAVGAYRGFVNAVACRAFAVALALGLRGNAMEPWQLGDFVAAGATGLRRHGATMRFMAGHALAMPLRALGELVLVTASTGHDARGLVDASFVTAVTARMS